MKKVLESPDNYLYHEKVLSPKTSLLFLILMLLFFFLAAIRWNSAGADWLTIFLFTLCGVFLFYVFNYRELVIGITYRAICLRFGIFTWSVPLTNIANCRIDELPLLLKMGGAGIHFMFVRGRYRASFNFLEYPRLVIVFKQKVGPVRDISFSTRHPEDVIMSIRAVISCKDCNHLVSVTL